MTYSNIKGRHGGLKNNLDFLDNFTKKIFFAKLQQEQSDSFLNKKNLNYYASINSKNFPSFLSKFDLYWFSSYEIIELALKGEILHADTRSVFFFILFEEIVRKFNLDINQQNFNYLISKFSLLTFKSQRPWHFLSIKEICNYKNKKIYLKSDEKKFDERYILGVRVNSKNNEIRNWEQPLLFVEEKVFIIFFTEIKNEIFILISINSSPGICTEFEILPSYIESFSKFNDEKYKNIFSNTKEIHNSWQTEEGGRFFRRKNLHKIYYCDSLNKFEDQDNLFWIKLSELYTLGLNTNYISMELRSICFILFSFLIRK